MDLLPQQARHSRRDDPTVDGASAFDRGARSSRPFGRSRRFAALTMALAIACALVGLPSWVVVHYACETWKRYALDHHGIAATGRVIAMRTDDTWSEEDRFFLTVAFGGDGDTAEVEVYSDDHPIGSSLQIRYDGNDPMRAIAVEDPPGTVGGFWLFVGIITLPSLFASLVRRLRRRRRTA
jgi:hypothetical protein